MSLQRQGITGLAHVTEEAVLAIFLSPDDTLRRSASYKKNVAAVVKAGLRDQGEAGRRIRAFLPALRETRKNIPYLTAEEITRVKAVLAPGDHTLTLRDQAIRTLSNSTRCPVLIIDEAQTLPATMLQELRFISNTQMDAVTPFACILVGQPVDTAWRPFGKTFYTVGKAKISGQGVLCQRR